MRHSRRHQRAKSRNKVSYAPSLHLSQRLLRCIKPRRKRIEKCLGKFWSLSAVLYCYIGSGAGLHHSAIVNIRWPFYIAEGRI